jgi:Ribbon-helix-helix protein, copG family
MSVIMLRMERTQIQLTPEQAKKVRRAAAERGISMAAYIRGAVEQRLSVEPTARARRRLVASIGGFRSDRSDVSRRHDAYLEEAFRE